ncbi:MAG: hypothetical protein Q7T74_03530 [Candidatus Saccharibacteria bacterium]|nr:hypothetical protein [Candidatus Saccharibacteria bacterium]
MNNRYETRFDTFKKRIKLPGSLFGFVPGFVVRNKIRNLDPIEDERQHFRLTHETLYSNQLMAKAFPGVIFAVAATIPSIAEKLDNASPTNVTNDAKKRNAKMMHSFGRTIDENQNISDKESKRLGKIHAAMNLKPDDMQFVIDLMSITERKMLAKFGSPEMEPHFQEAIINRWTTLGEKMGVPKNDRTAQEIEQSVDDYIRDNGDYTQAGHNVAVALLEDFANSFSRPRLQNVASEFFLSMLNGNVRRTLDLKEPTKTGKIAAKIVNRAYIASTPLRFVRTKPWTDFQP